MSLPHSMGQFLLFLLSTVLALCVVVAFAMLMYILLFYMLSQRGIKIIVTALTTFLSGGIIPLPFFPETVRNVVQLLPFAAMQNMPLLIYSGNIAGTEALKGIALQVFWFAVLFLIGKLAMGRALKKVIVQGG
jgi:ABC-2 type transport system permease protein